MTNVELLWDRGLTDYKGADTASPHEKLSLQTDVVQNNLREFTGIHQKDMAVLTCKALAWADKCPSVVGLDDSKRFLPTSMLL